MHSVVNFKEKFSRFNDHFSPKIVAQMNDYHFKLVKFQGDFVWHSHQKSDEVFIVIQGAMEIHFRDEVALLETGEMMVVPRGVEHKPFAAEECQIMLVEPAGLVNTGDAGGEKTAPNDVWI